MEIKVPLSDPGKVRAIKERFSLDLLSATVLERRGLENPSDALWYLETDIIGKYVEKLLTPAPETLASSGLTRDFLARHGW